MCKFCGGCQQEKEMGYWVRKIEGNRKRDRQVTRLLRADGWRVFRFWDRDIKENPSRCIARLRAAMNNHGN